MKKSYALALALLTLSGAAAVADSKPFLECKNILLSEAPIVPGGPARSSSIERGIQVLSVNGVLIARVFDKDGVVETTEDVITKNLGANEIQNIKSQVLALNSKFDVDQIVSVRSVLVGSKTDGLGIEVFQVMNAAGEVLIQPLTYVWFAGVCE